MTKKTTLRDVAKEACVSVATASYVLNNVSNQTIPEDTKNRVREAAERLNYVRNLNARSLSVGKTNVFGVLLVGDDSDLIAKYIKYGKFIGELERLSLERRYRLMVARIDPGNPNFDIILERKLDGVFLIDASESSFYEVAGKFPFGSPVVLVDAVIDDHLFRHVVYDLKQLFRIADGMCVGEPYAVVYESNHNRAIAERLRRDSGVPSERIWAATRDFAALRAFAERHRGKPLLVLNEFLALHLAKYVNPADLIVACTSDCPEFVPEGARMILPGDGKAQTALELMQDLLSEPYATERSGVLSFDDSPAPFA